MKRLIAALALVASLGMAGQALALDKKINIFNGAQYDIYTLYLSPTNANDWEENLLTATRSTSKSAAPKRPKPGTSRSPTRPAKP